MVKKEFKEIEEAIDYMLAQPMPSGNGVNIIYKEGDEFIAWPNTLTIKQPLDADVYWYETKNSLMEINHRV